MELILSDAAYVAMDAAEIANTYSWFKIVMSDSAAATTKTVNLGGYMTQFDLNLNGTGPSDVTVTFRASERE
jgi:hypothetical protein